MIEGIEWLVRLFVFILTVILVGPIVLFAVLLPTNITGLRRYFSRDYSKVPSLEIREFHNRLVQDWNHQKKITRLPSRI